MNSELFLKKTYVVTGAASGIGRALALRLMEVGANLILIDKDMEKLSIEFANSTSIYLIGVDLSDCDDVEIDLSSAILKMGKVSGFVHCAGIPCALPLKVTNKEIFENVVNINGYAGLFLFKLISARKFSANNFSAVFISSVYSIVGSSAASLYAFSKGGLNAAVRCLALEYANRKIRVNAVAPGFVKTEMLTQIKSGQDAAYEDKLTALHPLGLGEPDDVVNPVLFLLSSDSKWITGQVISVDGGYSVQ
jgi:NAD(P)-dependent dehydrogenase (short-subunit alcohol dehydrogenase family)